jgi:RNA polymerase sigma factor (sigma-70 family)
MKELELSVQVRNNRLKERREALGMNQKMFAKAAGIPVSTYGHLEGLRCSPITKTDKGYEWKKTTLNLANYYDVEPEELFPVSVLDIKSPIATRKLDSKDIMPLLSESRYQQELIEPPDSALERKEENEILQSTLTSLPPREAQALRLHYGFNKNGEHNITEIASMLDVCPERVRQIIQTALWRMHSRLKPKKKLNPL